MKKFGLLIFITMIVVPVRAQNRLPDVRTYDTQGRQVMLSDVAEDNKPIIYVFWGAICHSCNAGLNALNDEFDTWRDEFDFQVIAICTDDQRGMAKAKSKAVANEWPFTLLFDHNQDLKRAMNVTAVPYFIVTDKDGTITYSRAGYIPGTEQEIYNNIKNSF